MEDMRPGSDVLEKQETVKIRPASKKGVQRITNQPLVLPPNLNYLSSPSQQRMLIAFPLGNHLPSQGPPAAPALGLDQAAPLLATKRRLHRSIGLKTLSFPSRACCLPFPQHCLP